MNMTEKLFQTSEIKHLFDILNDGHFFVRVYIILFMEAKIIYIYKRERTS